MYKSFTAEDYKSHFGLPDTYRVDGLLLHGTWQFEKELESLETALSKIDNKYSINPIGNDSESFIGKQGKEIRIGDKLLWFMSVYGSAKTSEYTHLACLFGSKKNILIGSCGGLLVGAKMGDIIIPTESVSDGSSTFMYDRSNNERQKSDTNFSNSLALEFGKVYKTYQLPTTTCQAMLGESFEDVQEWSKQGFAGVEMEAASFFAVSNHFNVPAAAVLRIADNLIENETVHSDIFVNSKEARTQQKVVINEIVIKELLN